MTDLVGQMVLKSKPDVSCDCEQNSGQTVQMGTDSSTDYLAGFLGRVRAARELRFQNTTEAGQALGMKQDTYKQYETRTPLPHALMQRFCLVTGVTLHWLITGEGPGPRYEPYRPKSPRKRAAAVAKKPRRVA